jgi:tol-pal system protein YbgF
MKTKTICITLTILLVLVSSGLYAQFLSASRTGIGFNLGGARVYGGYRNVDGDPVKTGFGGALEFYGKYAISPRMFLVGSLGYQELSDGTVVFDNEATFSTGVLNFDLKAGVNLLTEGKFIPYAYGGLGAIMFKQDHLGGLPGTYFDPAFFFGGGFETKFSPQLSLNATVDYRFTGSDDLDPESYDGSAKDGYLTVRTGLTYYLEPTRFGLGNEIEISEKTPIDELDMAELPGFGEEGDAGTDDLNALIEGIDNYDEASGTEAEMGEYAGLKSRVEELNDAIGQKELEVEDLKSQLDYRKDKIAELQGRNVITGSGKRPAFSGDISDISASYNEALQTFYTRDYGTAIQQFNLLLETSPLHKLASNCQYWIGESYFGKRDYVNASQAFEQVLTFEKSHKKDDALLMLGRCYINMGDKPLAVQMFEQLMNSFPDSEYYEKAQKYAGI